MIRPGPRASLAWNTRHRVGFLFALILASSFIAALSAPAARAQPTTAPKKPNVLVIWGDDIGTWNISHNNRGMMGYRTPNIDRIAKEGIAFTDYYGQQSCTAGRAAFIGGNVPVRTGMTKVGLPGADEALGQHQVGQVGFTDLGEHLVCVHGGFRFRGRGVLRISETDCVDRPSPAISGAVGARRHPGRKALSGKFLQARRA